MSAEPLLRVEGLEKHFPVTAGVMGRVVAQVKAVDGVSFEIEAGTTLGLVGESGCGKTTVGLALLRLLQPTGGRIVFSGVDTGELSAGDLRDLRRDMQIVFQDPFNSLNPRMTVSDIVGEAMRIHGLATRANVDQKVAAVLERVGLPAAWMNRYPHEFSGGQRQRISIARAIALEPKLIVCDESVSALDVSIKAQVINLLIDLQAELGLSYLFISHDLSVVKHISDRIAVMYLGQIVETAPSRQLFETPCHPYTRALLSAIPVPDPTRRPERIVLEGDVPTPLDPPPGCHFHTRCPAVMSRCRSEEPPTIALSNGQSARCFLAEGLGQRANWYAALCNANDRAEEANRLANGHVDVDTSPTTRDPSSSIADAPAPVPNDAGIERIEVDPRPGYRVAALAMAIGAGLTALGHPAWGAAIGLGTYFVAARPNLRRSAPWTIACLLTLLMAGFVGRSLEDGRDLAEARAQLARFEEALDRYVGYNDHYPPHLEELGWRLFEIVGQADPIDPWGNRWRYQPPVDLDLEPALTSAGPNGRFGDADDIGRALAPSAL